MSLETMPPPRKRKRSERRFKAEADPLKLIARIKSLAAKNYKTYRELRTLIGKIEGESYALISPRKNVTNDASASGTGGIT